jgi:hypothetical protein
MTGPTVVTAQLVETAEGRRMRERWERLEPELRWIAVEQLCRARGGALYRLPRPGLAGIAADWAEVMRFPTYGFMVLASGMRGRR